MLKCWNHVAGSSAENAKSCVRYIRNIYVFYACMPQESFYKSFMTTSISRSVQSEPSLPANDGSASDSPLAFKALLFFIFVLYVAPQGIIPALEPLKLGKLSAGLAIVSYGIATLSQGRRFTVLTPEVKLIFGFVALAVVSIPLSGWPGGSFEFFLDIFSKSVILFFMVVNLLPNLTRLRQMIWGVSIYSTIDAGIAIKNYLGGNVLFSGSTSRARGGYSGVSGDPNDLALCLNIAIPFIWYLRESSQNRLEKMLLTGMLLGCVAGVMVSFSRGGFLGLLGLFIWAVIIHVRKHGPAVLIRAALLGAVFFALAPGGYTDRMHSIANTSEDQTGSADVRWTIMKRAAQISLEHPFGAGLKMHNILLKDVNTALTGVHSAFLEVAADLGIVGGVLFAVIFLKLILAMQAVRNSPVLNPNIKPLAEAAEISLVAFGVSGMFLAVAYQAPFYLLAGIAVAIKDVAGRADNDGDEQPPSQGMVYAIQPIAKDA
jgi:putative inorganic carbon (hco3(-)) transporter